MLTCAANETRMNKRLNSFKYAWNGIRKTVKSERNMQIHLLFVVAVVGCGLVFHISRMEWIACVICFGMVISAELINTAIETIVNMVSPEWQPLAGKAKDIAAGAVLAAAIFAAITGIIIFLPKFMELINAR